MNFLLDSFIGSGYSTPGEVTLGVICACAPTWKPLSRKLAEIARSRFFGLRSSRTYHDVEQDGSTTYVQSSGTQDSGNGRHKASRSVDLLPLQKPHVGQSHGIYEAKQNGLPETQTNAYRSRSGQESPVDSYGTLQLPIQGIQVKHEVTVQQDGSRPFGNDSSTLVS